jgi:heme oxygenase
VAPAVAPVVAHARPVAALLRERTAVAHARLDALLAIDEATLDLAYYRKLLAALYGFVAPWETALHAALEDIDEPAFADRRHRARLERDLQVLGIDPATLPRAARLPELATPAAALGSAYVLEGSTLGGKLISGIVSRRLGFSALHGCAYFAGYGDRTGAMWLSFRTHLETRVPPSQHDDAVRGAVASFEHLTDWMRDALATRSTAAGAHG